MRDYAFKCALRKAQGRPSSPRDFLTQPGILETHLCFRIPIRQYLSEGADCGGVARAQSGPRGNYDTCLSNYDTCVSRSGVEERFRI